MTKYLRPSLLASILAGVVCGLGCNPLALPSFLAPEPSIPPEMQALTVPDKKGPVNIVIVTYNGQDLREEFVGVDRQLSDLLARRMKEMSEFSGDKFSFVSLRKVEEYKSSHPRWTEDLAAVGRDLHADFVLYLEINSMSLYEKGSRGQLFHGEAEISVSLRRVADEDAGTMRKEFHEVYPKTRGPVPVDEETSLTDFRQQFLTFIATRVGRYFVSHPTSGTYMED
jgi:hypothetical protein